ncbi:GNAT family N-acetyltransferase [Microcoleus sp. D2_18a_D3]|uniref:GNAT family N-acetyltransferase n=1 Tax=Microcoleus sp. D2_18a_D3 TaxID=3055330 RepID=UPI002FCFB2F6
MLKSFSESREPIILLDREGREYRLKVDGDKDRYFIAKLLYRNSEVGMINCVFDPPGELMIGDLLIHNDIIHTPPHLLAALWRLLVKPKPIDYRQKGLGTHLLQFAIAIARQRGVRRIYGSLIQKDINNNPNLVKWYKKHGFQILPPSAENIDTAVCGISMDLEGKSS